MIHRVKKSLNLKVAIIAASLWSLRDLMYLP